MPRTVLYLHGFLSGPSSPKAVLLGAACARRGVPFLAPDINRVPAVVWQQLQTLTEHTDLAVVGSSLGGFYALKLAERFGIRTVLVNPALQPWMHIATYVGSQMTREGKVIEVRSEYAQMLQELRPALPSDFSRLLVYLSEDDEVLDWREAATYFPASTQVRLKGEGHALRGFANYVDRIVDFALG